MQQSLKVHANLGWVGRNRGRHMVASRNRPWGWCGWSSEFEWDERKGLHMLVFCVVSMPLQSINCIANRADKVVCQEKI
jgi:hypothetical protein